MNKTLNSPSSASESVLFESTCVNPATLFACKIRFDFSIKSSGWRSVSECVCVFVFFMFFNISFFPRWSLTQSLLEVHEWWLSAFGRHDYLLDSVLDGKFNIVASYFLPSHFNLFLQYKRLNLYTKCGYSYRWNHPNPMQVSKYFALTFFSHSRGFVLKRVNSHKELFLHHVRKIKIIFGLAALGFASQVPWVRFTSHGMNNKS